MSVNQFVNINENILEEMQYWNYFRKITIPVPGGVRECIIVCAQGRCLWSCPYTNSLILPHCQAYIPAWLGRK